jgi:threonine/homoserine/homoserine lactone efflux protein
MEDILPQFLLAWSIQLTGVLSPGPGVALILGVATAQGRRAALLTTLGIASGSIILCLATIIGIAALFADIAGAMTVIRFVGAAYLAWLAWGAFRKAVNPPTVIPNKVKARSAARQWTTGFLLQITNPKAIFFWLAIAAIGGVGDAPPPMIALFVAVSFMNSLFGHGLWAMVFSTTALRAAYASARRPIEACLGTFFTFAAFRLATARS